MVHWIIIIWLNRIGVWIWNLFRVKFNWKIWGVNFNITIINGMMIKSSRDSWNHRAGFGRKGYGFEVSCWMFSSQLSWRLIWFFTITFVEIIRLSYQTWWEGFWATDDAGISPVSNSSTAFSNTLLSRTESCNNCMEKWCIIVDGIWRTEMMIAMIWSGKCCWKSNHLYIMIDSMNFSSFIDSIFSVVFQECN